MNLRLNHRQVPIILRDYSEIPSTISIGRLPHCLIKRKTSTAALCGTRGRTEVHVSLDLTHRLQKGGGGDRLGLPDSHRVVDWPGPNE